MAGPAQGQAFVEWRQLAKDKNVSQEIARGLWEQAKSASPTDQVARSNLFRKLLEDAAKNPQATPTPGKANLVDAKQPNDPASLGPGKTTQVLADKGQQQQPPKPAGSAVPPPIPADAKKKDPAAKDPAKPPPIPADAKKKDPAAKPADKAAVDQKVADWKKDVQNQPPTAAPPKKSDAEVQLEEFVTSEIAALSAKKFGAANKETVAGLANDLGAFELGLGLKIGKFGSNPKVAEARTFISEKRADIELQSLKVLDATVSPKARKPKLDPAGYKEVEGLKKDVEPWQLAFNKDAAQFTNGVKLCADLMKSIDQALASILAHRDSLLKTAKTTIEGVDVNKPGTVIADEIAKVQIWLDAILLPDPGSLRAAVQVAKKLKEEDIKKAADAKAAEAKKAAEAAKAADAAKQAEAHKEKDPAKEQQQAKPQAADQKQPAAADKPKELTPKDRAELEAKKYELELKLVQENLELLMEKSLKGYEIFNLGSSTALTAAALLAHLAPQIAIPLAVGKAGLMFWKKYSKKKGYLQAKNQLLFLSPEQLQELAALFASDLYSFKDAIDMVDKAAKVAKFQTGAGADTAKKEAAPLAVDTVEVGAGAAAAAGIHTELVEWAHIGSAAVGPVVAGIQLALNYREAAHVKEKIEAIEAKIAEIDGVLGRPRAPAPKPPPAPAVEEIVIPPLQLPPPPKAAAPAKKDEKPDELAAAPAEPIVETTTMAGVQHTLKADAKTGDIEFNSIRGFAVAKLKSIMNLVPEPVKARLTAALAHAMDATALVLDPALKPGAKPNDRPAVVKRLAAKLKELAGSIRAFGDASHYTDSDPTVVTRKNEEDKKQKEQLAQAGASPAATSPTTTAAPAAPKAPTAKDPAAPAAPSVKDPAAPTAPAGGKADVKKADAPPIAVDPAAPATAGAPAVANAPAKDPAKDGKEAAPAAAKDAPHPNQPAESLKTAPPGVAIEYEGYANHIRTQFAGELQKIRTKIAETAAAQGGAVKRAQKTLELTLADIDKVKAELKAAQAELDKELAKEKQDELQAKQDAVSAKEEELKAKTSALPHAGDTTKQLLEKAKAKVKEIQGLAKKEAKPKIDELEGILQASMLLSSQWDPESQNVGRDFYKNVDETENVALIAKARTGGLSEKDCATLAVNQRNWLRKFVRVELMDKDSAEITFLRDEGKSGSRNGMSVKKVAEKVILELQQVDPETKKAALRGDFTFGTATPEELDLVYKGMIESAGKTNKGVNAISGVGPGGKPPTTPTTPTTPAAPPAPPTAPTAQFAAPAAPAGKDAAPTAQAPTAPAGKDAATPTAPTAQAPAAPAGKEAAPPAAPPTAPTAQVPTAPAGKDAAPPTAKTAQAPTAPAGKDAAPPTAPTAQAPTAPAGKDPAVKDPAAPATAPTAQPPADPATKSDPAVLGKVTATYTEVGNHPVALSISPTGHVLANGGDVAAKSDSEKPKVIATRIEKETTKFLAATTDAEREAALAAIKVDMEKLRAAMATARGEDNPVVGMRVRYEKHIGAKIFAEAPGFEGAATAVNQMAQSALRMVANSRGETVAAAASIDVVINTIKSDPKLREEIEGVAGDPKLPGLGKETNIGWAGSAGRSFDKIVDALTKGSLTEKAVHLINFGDEFLKRHLIKRTQDVLKQVRDNLASIGSRTNIDTKIDAVHEAKGDEDKEKEAKKGLFSESNFQDDKVNSQKDAQGKIVGMDAKTPQVPLEALDHESLVGLAKQNAVTVEPTDDDKQIVAKLKAKGVKPKTMAHMQAMPDKDGLTKEGMPYLQGIKVNMVNPDHKWIIDAKEAEMPLKAGISGTTHRFLGLGELLGVKDKLGMRLAMLGHLQAIEAHSFWEICDAAGIPSGPERGRYIPFDPVSNENMKHAAEEILATDPAAAEITGKKDREAQIARLLGTDKAAPPSKS